MTSCAQLKAICINAIKVKLDDKDKKLLAKSLKKNKEFLASVQMTKKELDADDISMIERALNHRYKYSTY